MSMSGKVSVAMTNLTAHARRKTGQMPLAEYIERRIS
jgi:hypothetical protein